MMSKSIDSDIYRDICSNNGYENLDHNSTSHMDIFEIFFSGLPYMITLTHFTSLQELVIIDQNITSIKNLENLVNLKKLWICECQIRKIENLHFCTKLECLYLYDNMICRIEHLNSLKHLSILWLNDNYIKKIENLSCLNNLTELNLAGNFITRIGDGLLTNKKISSLNLCGNFLDDLDDIIHVSYLDNLMDFCLESSEYQANPICRHPNYQNVIIFSMPQLKYLNNNDVGQKSLKASVKNLFNDKLHFYYIQYKHLQAEYDRINKNLFDIYGKRVSKILNQLKDYHSLFCGYSEKLNVCEEKSVFSIKRERSEKEISDKESILNMYMQNLKKALFELDIIIELKRTLLLEEMNGVGNLINSELDVASETFGILGQLVQTRFCIHQKAFTPIKSVQLLAGFKLFNKTNENLYREEIKRLNLSGCSYVEEFWFSQIKEDPITNFKDIMKNIVNHDCKKPLSHWTHSLNMADENRLESYMTEGVNNYKGIPNYARCILYRVITKAYNTSNIIIPCSCPVKFCKVLHKNYTEDLEFICSLPEFVLEIEYISENVHSKDIFKNELYPARKRNVSGLKQDHLSDAEDLSYDFAELSRSDNASNYIANNKLERRSHLNLYGFNLSRIKPGVDSKWLTSLVLTDCGLYTCEIINCPNLEFLNLSHNYICSLHLIPFLPLLKNLDISFNSLNNSVECAQFLKDRAPKIVILKTKYNHWPKYGLKHEDPFIYYLSMLKNLNDEPISSAHIETAKANFLENAFSFEEISTYGSLDYIENKWWFGLVTTNLTSFGEKKLRLNKTVDETNFHTVQCLAIQSKHLYKIEPISRFSHLRQINFDHNFIKSLHPFSKCSSLEILSLNYNHIANLDGLNNLKCLKIFHASNNRIYVISPSQLFGLKALKLLSLDSNQISSVDGLEKLTKLEELYMANNCISDMGNILQLRFLQRLRVLELSGNPILYGSDNSFSQLIFHLKNLRALNGKKIQSSDFQTAKELLGGRLTNELVIEKIGHNQFTEVTRFDFASSSIRLIDVRSSNQFHNLTHVNMENNSLTSFSGLLYLENIKVLCLNQNKIETLVPKHTPDKNLKSTSTQLLPHLEVLLLANNGLKSLQPLQLHRISSIQYLFLQSNELTTVEGLDGLQNIKILVLDKNRIKSLSEISLLYNWNLRELYVEDNRLRDLQNIGHLEKLQVLFAGNNKITNLHELSGYLINLKNLREISVVENPMAKRNLHRLVIAYNLPNVTRIDGVNVCIEEKERAAAFYAEQEYHNLVSSNPALASSITYANFQNPEMLAHLSNSEGQSFYAQNSFLTQLHQVQQQHQQQQQIQLQVQNQKSRLVSKGDYSHLQSYRRDSAKSKSQRCENIIMGQQMVAFHQGSYGTVNTSGPLNMSFMLNASQRKPNSNVRQISPKFIIPSENSNHNKASNFTNPGKWYPPKR